MVDREKPLAANPEFLNTKLTKYLPFTREEIEASGGIMFDLRLEQNQTILNQMKRGIRFKFHPNLDDLSREKRWKNLLSEPPINAQVIVWTDPKMRFVPRSGLLDPEVREKIFHGNEKIMKEKWLSYSYQEILVREAAKEMRKMTGLGENVHIGIPSAATITTLMEKFWKMGIDFLGPRYSPDFGLHGFGIAAMASDVVGENKNRHAYVGYTHPNIGIEIGDSTYVNKDVKIKLDHDNYMGIVFIAVKPLNFTI